MSRGARLDLEDRMKAQVVENDLVPLIQNILEKFHKKSDGRSLCGACGCLVMPADGGCPNCRLVLTRNKNTP